jgi:hypothetical protein
MVPGLRRRGPNKTPPGQAFGGATMIGPATVLAAAIALGCRPGPAQGVVTICPLVSALVFRGTVLNSSTPGQLELASRPGTCLVASGDRESPCDGHGCIVEAPCANGDPEACQSALCEWETAPAPGGGVQVQMLDARNYPVCLDYNEDAKQVQAFDCGTTTGHANRSAFQHWFFTASDAGGGFTIRTTMKNHSSSAYMCVQNATTP